jgi:hypothetical protein
MNAGAPTKKQKPERLAAGLYLSAPFSSTGIPACAPSCQGLRVCETRKQKNAFFDLAGVARASARYYVGTGVIFTSRLSADACATEKQKPRCVSIGALFASRFATRIEFWCGRVDSNHHGIATASPSSWCVCQFRHDRFVPMQLTSSEVRPLCDTPIIGGFRCGVNIRASLYGNAVR